jgi:hypothetical protein
LTEKSLANQCRNHDSKVTEGTASLNNGKGG